MNFLLLTKDKWIVIFPLSLVRSETPLESIMSLAAPDGLGFTDSEIYSLKDTLNKTEHAVHSYAAG